MRSAARHQTVVFEGLRLIYYPDTLLVVNWLHATVIGHRADPRRPAAPHPARCCQRRAKIFTPEDIHSNQPGEELARASASGRSDDRRLHLRRDGTRFHADGVVTAIRDDQGVVRSFSKVMHDVTAQVAASEALRDSEERYRLLVDNIRDYAIFLLCCRTP